MKKFFDNCYHVIKQKYDIQDSYKYKNVTTENSDRIFPDKLIAEMNGFIFETNLTVDTISDNRALIYYAKNYMNYINSIPTSIDIDLTDILSNKRYQSMWERLNKVGDFISVEYKRFGLNKTYLRLLSYTHDPLSGNLHMKFSNEYELKNIYNTFLNGVVKTALSLSRSASKYQSSWDEYLKKKEMYLQEGQDIDASINSIRSNGKLIVGKDGVTLSKQANNAIMQYADGLYVSRGMGEDYSMSFNSETGLAVDLTVNSVKTDFKRAYNYLNSIQTNIDYIYLHDEKFLFISDVFASATPIQLTGADGTKMYYKTDPASWEGGATINNINKQMTSNVTDYVVNVYRYTSYIKGSWSFENEVYTQSGSNTQTVNAIPVLTMGTGDGNGNGTAVFKKTDDGLCIEYKSRTTGIKSGWKIKDDNIYQIRGNSEYIMYPVMVVDEMPESFPEDTLVFVKEE